MRGRLGPSREALPGSEFSDKTPPARCRTRSYVHGHPFLTLNSLECTPRTSGLYLPPVRWLMTFAKQNCIKNTFMWLGLIYFMISLFGSMSKLSSLERQTVQEGIHVCCLPSHRWSDRGPPSAGGSQALLPRLSITARLVPAFARPHRACRPSI